MSRDRTTKEVAERFEVDDQAARRWCREGRFPNAYQLPIKTGTGQVWMVPEEDLNDFTPPTAGRPLSDNPSEAALRKREQRARNKSGRK